LTRVDITTYNVSMDTATTLKPISKQDDLISDSASCCTPTATPPNTREIASQSRILTALAEPTRLAIVSLLSTQDEPLCVCEIVTQFDLGQPTISHHLRVLREARLVDCEKRGLWVYYWLNRDVLSQVTSYLTTLQRMTSGALAY
jgi:ArsR family transcriptional regulator